MDQIITSSNVPRTLLSTSLMTVTRSLQSTPPESETLPVMWENADPASPWGCKVSSSSSQPKCCSSPGPQPGRHAGKADGLGLSPRPRCEALVHIWVKPRPFEVTWKKPGPPTYSVTKEDAIQPQASPCMPAPASQQVWCPGRLSQAAATIGPCFLSTLTCGPVPSACVPSCPSGGPKCLEVKAWHHQHCGSCKVEAGLSPPYLALVLPPSLLPMVSTVFCWTLNYPDLNRILIEIRMRITNENNWISQGDTDSSWYEQWQEKNLDFSSTTTHRRKKSPWAQDYMKWQYTCSNSIPLPHSRK